ncbi:MAG: 6-phosphofructokinase, partial [Firmicutes bacterium]|nr:6-phosphofructokinase [Bacillota bacterium]
MEKLVGAAIYIQGGGPTPVINNSFLGLFNAANKSKVITKVYCAKNGLYGLIEGQLYCLNDEDPEEVKLLEFTPSMAFGSSRYQLRNTDKEKNVAQYQ